MILKVLFLFLEKIITLLRFYTAGKKESSLDFYLAGIRTLFEELIGKSKVCGWTCEAHHRYYADCPDTIDDDGRLLPYEGQKGYVNSNYWVYLILSVYVSRIITFGYDKDSQIKLMRMYTLGLMANLVDDSLVPEETAHRLNTLELIAWSLRCVEADTQISRLIVKKIGRRMSGIFRKYLRLL